MTTVPAMMLWTDAYMADTSHLTTTEHGAYLLILMAMWRAGGMLPDDDIRLARVAKLTLDKWRKVAPTIREFLTVEGDRVTQKRLKRELEIAFSKAEKYAAAGRTGGNAKALKNNNRVPSDANILPLANGWQLPSLSEPEPNKKDTRARERAVDSRFEEFWRAWPNKVGKPAAKRAFRRVASESAQILSGLERYVKTKPPGRDWLNPATFLNQRRWEDSPADASSSNGSSRYMITA